MWRWHHIWHHPGRRLREKSDIFSGGNEGLMSMRQKKRGNRFSVISKHGDFVSFPSYYNLGTFHLLLQ